MHFRQHMYEFVKHIKISNLISQCHISNEDIITKLVPFRARIPCTTMFLWSSREMQSTPPCMAAKEPVGLTRLVMCRRRKSFWMARGGACLSWYVQNSSRHCMKHDGAFQISCCDGSILLLECTLRSNVNICLKIHVLRKNNIFDRCNHAMLYLFG